MPRACAPHNLTLVPWHGTAGFASDADGCMTTDGLGLARIPDAGQTEYCGDGESSFGDMMLPVAPWRAVFGWAWAVSSPQANPWGTQGPVLHPEAKGGSGNKGQAWS